MHRPGIQFLAGVNCGPKFPAFLDRFRGLVQDVPIRLMMLMPYCAYS
jgi:hypothetical protein